MKVTIQDSKTSVTVRPRDFKVTVSGARGPQGPPGEAGASEWGDIGGTLSNQTDLQNALDAKVPYTGATQDVNLGEYGAQLGNLEFDNTPTNIPTTAGSVYWNDTDGTLNIVLKGGQTISRVGETQHIRALNNTGAEIARGKVVYVVGAQGQRLTIALADADTEILSKDTIGFTAEAIADGAEGFVIVQGVINNVNTNGMTDGATVYLSQTAGSYTTTPPSDPAHLVILGFIVNGGSGGAGSIYVKVDNGYELEELHNISDSAKTTPVGDDALLLRDSADNNLWKRLTWTNALAGVKTHMDTFKSVAGGYASLDGSGKVPSSELPSYVDDVVEVANYASLPGTGETGKIYVTLDTNKCYRWSGSVYVEVSSGGGIDTLTTTGTSGAATLVGNTLNIPQYQGVLTNPVTGTGTAGQVAYWDGTNTVTGSSSLVYDDINNRLKFGTTTGTGRINLPDSGSTTSDGIYFGTNISIYRSGSNEITTSGTLRVTSNFTVANGVSGIYNTGRFVCSPNTLTGSSNTPSLQLNQTWNTTGDPNAILLNVTNTASGALSNLMNLQIGGVTNFLVSKSGNTSIGTTDINSRLTVRGSGTTSATTALLVQNSTPSELFKVTDDGQTTLSPTANTSALVSSTYSVTGSGTTPLINLSGTWNTTANVTAINLDVTNTASGVSSNLFNCSINGTTNVFSIRRTGEAIVQTTYSFHSSNGIINATSSLTIQTAASQTPGVIFNKSASVTATSGDFQTVTLNNTSNSFAPTSGTATFTSIRAIPTINQTGGANGITRGLYVNPTLTAAADWRSVEFSNNTGWGLYGAGTANNYLGGSLGIGSTSLLTSNLRISKNITGGATSYILLGSGEIRSDVTSSARLVSVGATTQAASFNLTNAQIFFAEGIATSGIGAGSSITNQMGFHAHSTLTGATNNYGFYGNIASGTGSWNIYINGTAANYLAGNTSIGTTTSSGRLTVRGSGTTSATNGLLVEDSGGTDTFTIRDDGGYAFKGGTVGVAQTGYTTFTNLTTDRTCDANSTTVEELADILGTLIEDLKTKGIIAA